MGEVIDPLQASNLRIVRILELSPLEIGNLFLHHLEKWRFCSIICLFQKDGEKKAAAAEGGEKKAAGAGDKKPEGPINTVLKLDLHCEGCAKKVKRAVSHFEGTSNFNFPFFLFNSSISLKIRNSIQF